MRLLVVTVLTVPGFLLGFFGPHFGSTPSSSPHTELTAATVSNGVTTSAAHEEQQEPPALAPFKLQLMGARGFYYITTPPGFSGMEVETDRVRATSDGTTMVIAILNQEDRVYLLEGGGPNQQATVTPKAGGAAVTIGLKDYTIGAPDPNGNIVLTAATKIDSRHDLFGLVDKMVDTADDKNLPFPAVFP